jgi:hypothetical protein
MFKKLKIYTLIQSVLPPMKRLNKHIHNRAIVRLPPPPPRYALVPHVPHVGTVPPILPEFLDVHKDRLCNFVDSKTNKRCACLKVNSSESFCRRHGGGRRCQFHVGYNGYEPIVCNNSALSGSPLCSKHTRTITPCRHFDSEGNYCQNKRAGKSVYCLVHGGGRQCDHVDEKTGEQCTAWFSATHTYRCKRHKKPNLPKW